MKVRTKAVPRPVSGVTASTEDAPDFPIIDITVRDLIGPWAVDLGTDVGHRDALVLTLAVIDPDTDRARPLTLSKEGRALTLPWTTVASVRDLARALVRVADAMEAQ